MTVPANDGCLWPLDPACLEDEWETEFDEPAKLRAQALASATLRRLTAYRVGGCSTVVRPCGSACAYSYSSNPIWQTSSSFVPANWAGSWTNCGCAGACIHNPKTSVKLPPPVYEVTEVKVNGAIVPSTNYWVSGGYLIAKGSQTWPMTQNLDLPDTEAGTFSITYFDSAPVDGMGAYAAGKLAMEYARACSGGVCALPETVTSIARQGVTYDIPAGSFPNGETGIREVDAFIALWNPGHRRMRPQVWVP